MPVRFTSILLLAAATVARASIDPASHAHTDDRRLPSRWYHEEGHPVHSLFRRAGSNDGVTYAAIGTPEWSAGFPADLALATMPQAWIDALSRAVTAGKIPDIPVSTSSNLENPTYPTGYDPYSATVCSSTYKCVTAGDVWDAPPGVLALSFDDGPLPASGALYDFLVKNNERVTHFFIGQNILSHPQEFQTAINNQDDLAVHTWTHPFMTSKSNEEVVAELGWSMWIVHNSTGGRIPRFWRPPYGDSDMRVRAIAKEVFGLTTVIWNQDTDDWTLDQNPPGTTLEKIGSQMQTWLTGPKTTGLVILEHELSDLSVQSFMAAYPLMVANGWKRVSLAQMDGLGAYLNALDAASPVTPAQVGDPNIKPPPANTTVLHQAV
ncbi:carbohydrate esterase family 4 protein [Boletus edulis BED1]|uniref:chitin deacetylase n=1 Tax=Boletus edulis BED1 TaxID=1328754 RepID=A0AAD4C882_BOLED|nr:carbohydrate esterase family 4 protein [Boletus edulis BED1]